MLLQRIRKALEAPTRRATKLAARRANHPNLANNYYNMGNFFVIGDSIDITNDLWGGRGTRGVVVTAERRLVEIRVDSGAYHRCAYLNLMYYLPEDVDDEDDESE